MKEHHLQLNLAKTELLVFPATPTLQHDFTIQLGSSTITPSSPVRNLGVIFDDQLSFKDHIAYKTTTGSAPTYFHSLLRIYIPSRSLRSASERRLVVPSQRGSKSLSRTFSFTVPGCWNDPPPPPHPDCWIPVNLQATTENSSLSTLLDYILN